MTPDDRGGERGVQRYNVLKHDLLETTEGGALTSAEERVVLATSYDALAAERDRLVEALRDLRRLELRDDWDEELETCRKRVDALLASFSGGVVETPEEHYSGVTGDPVRAALSGGRT